MTDLLTQEEREMVERVRQRIREDEAWGGCDTDAAHVLAIIDNLLKRGVKKYSEEELRAGFEEFNGWRWDEDEENYEQWIVCARFLGALEEK